MATPTDNPLSKIVYSTSNNVPGNCGHTTYSRQMKWSAEQNATLYSISNNYNLNKTDTARILADIFPQLPVQACDQPICPGWADYVHQHAATLQKTNMRQELEKRYLQQQEEDVKLSKTRAEELKATMWQRAQNMVVVSAAKLQIKLGGTQPAPTKLQEIIAKKGGLGQVANITDLVRPTDPNITNHPWYTGQLVPAGTVMNSPLDIPNPASRFLNEPRSAPHLKLSKRNGNMNEIPTSTSEAAVTLSAENSDEEALSPQGNVRKTTAKKKKKGRAPKKQTPSLPAAVAASTQPEWLAMRLGTWPKFAAAWYRWRLEQMGLPDTITLSTTLKEMVDVVGLLPTPIAYNAISPACKKALDGGFHSAWRPPLPYPEDADTEDVEMVDDAVIGPNADEQPASAEHGTTTTTPQLSGNNERLPPNGQISPSLSTKATTQPADSLHPSVQQRNAARLPNADLPTMPPAQEPLSIATKSSHVHANENDPIVLCIDKKRGAWYSDMHGNMICNNIQAIKRVGALSCFTVQFSGSQTVNIPFFATRSYLTRAGVGGRMQGRKELGDDVPFEPVSSASLKSLEMLADGTIRIQEVTAPTPPASTTLSLSAHLVLGPYGEVRDAAYVRDHPDKAFVYVRQGQWQLAVGRAVKPFVRMPQMPAPSRADGPPDHPTYEKRNPKNADESRASEVIYPFTMPPGSQRPRVKKHARQEAGVTDVSTAARERQKTRDPGSGQPSQIQTDAEQELRLPEGVTLVPAKNPLDPPRPVHGPLRSIAYVDAHSDLPYVHVGKGMYRERYEGDVGGVVQASQSSQQLRAVSGSRLLAGGLLAADGETAPDGRVRESQTPGPPRAGRLSGMGGDVRQDVGSVAGAGRRLQGGQTPRRPDAAGSGVQGGTKQRVMQIENDMGRLVSEEWMRANRHRPQLMFVPEEDIKGMWRVSAVPMPKAVRPAGLGTESTQKPQMQPPQAKRRETEEKGAHPAPPSKKRRVVVTKEGRKTVVRGGADVEMED